MGPKPHLSLMIDAEIPRDGVQPRRELGFSTEIVASLDDPHPNVLIELLGASAIPHRPQDEVEEGPTVSPKQRLERGGVASSVGRKKVSVRAIGQTAPPIAA